MIKMTLSQPEIKMRIDPAKVVYTGEGKPYEGAYDVTPKSYEPVVLPTRNRLLSRDVNVAKIPRYEVSNDAGGVTFIIGDEYMNMG